MEKRIIAIVLLLVGISSFFIIPTAVNTSKNNVESKNSTYSSDVSEDDTSLEETSSDSEEDKSSSESEKDSGSSSSKKEDSELIEIPPSLASPVELHGQLSVKGANIVDKNGKTFQLIGMSTHGLTWFPDQVSKKSLQTLRDGWGCNSIRLAMYIDEWGNSECYINNKATSKELMIKGIDYAIDLGMYVVVDWHVLNPGDPTKYTNDAISFFKEISTKYKDYPNIIYEIANEPNGDVKWNTTIKGYSEKVISEIRKIDKKNIIVCGTATWSQDIQDVVNNRVSDKNTVYALHFYADTHQQWLRDRMQDCYDKGLPILVTEFGTCDASGGGGVNAQQTKLWLEHMDKLKIGYFNWSLANKDETCSVLKPNVSMSKGDWTESELTTSGKLIYEWYRKK